MSLLDIGQDVGRTMHAVDVLVSIQERLEAAGDDEALHHFLRLSPSELSIMVKLEAGIR